MGSRPMMDSLSSNSPKFIPENHVQRWFKVTATQVDRTVLYCSAVRKLIELTRV